MPIRFTTRGHVADRLVANGQEAEKELKRIRENNRRDDDNGEEVVLESRQPRRR